MTPEAAITDLQQRTRRRRKSLLLALLLIGLAGAVFFGYPPLRDEWRLQAAIAEADRLDPGWRWEDILARRRVVPDDANSALRVLKAASLIPKGWPGGAISEYDSGDFSYSLEYNLTAQLDGLRVAALQEELAKVGQVVREARIIADLPSGSFPISINPEDVTSPKDKHFYAIGPVCDLLWYDALLRSQNKDIDGALVSCRAMINARRSLGNDPHIISLIARKSHYSALIAVQRAMAQGEASDATLAQLQQTLIDEETQPLMLSSLRLVRASANHYADAIRSGEVSDASLQKTLGMVQEFWRERSGESKWETGWQWLDDRLESWREQSRGSPKLCHAMAIEYMNQWVELAKQPLASQKDRAEELEARLNRMPVMVRCLIAGGPKSIWYGSIKLHADLRAAIASLAAERFRRAHGRWPESLQELVPAYLAEVPRDPFDNQQLRYVRKPDGIIIYSIGHDCKDDGGDVLQTPEKRPDDIGFRLWDIAQRRQAPMPPPKAKPAEERSP